MAVGMLPFDGPESGQQSLGETMPKYRHTLERVLALLGPRGLACLFGSRISQVIGHLSLSLLVLWLCWFPEILTRPRNFYMGEYLSRRIYFPYDRYFCDAQSSICIVAAPLYSSTSRPNALGLSFI
jgi:hypothetical protein